jgi:hypothetical protein
MALAQIRSPAPEPDGQQDSHPEQDSNAQEAPESAGASNHQLSSFDQLRAVMKTPSGFLVMASGCAAPAR